MAPFLQTLILLLSTLAFLLNAATAKPPSKTTSFSYDFTSTKPTDLTYQADAHFPSDAAVLRLTKTDENGNAVQLSIGRVLYTNPITFWDKKAKTSFQTDLKFIIKTNAGYQNPPADGLVFFITAVDSAVNAPGGSFGVFDDSGNNPSVFAVEFDTFVNEDFDPYYKHVGIDIQSHKSSNVSAVGEGIVGQEVTATIKYDGKTNLISVSGSAGGQSFEVSYVYDLSTFLPQQVQVGISATTGGLTAVHDVMAWSFTSSTRVNHV